MSRESRNLCSSSRDCGGEFSRAARQSPGASIRTRRGKLSRTLGLRLSMRIWSTMHGMKNVLRGVTTFALFVAGFSLFLEVGERYHWVEPAYIGLAVAFLLVGSLIKLWRAVRYGDFKVTSHVFWLPRSWRAWMCPGNADDERPHPR